MLRLSIFIKDSYLRVRLAQPGEVFSKPVFWKDAIEFELSPTSDYTMIWTSLLPDLAPKDANALVELVAARYPFSPHYDELHGLCPGVVFANQSDEWVFFGGTFNPWHAGHQACLNLIPADKTCFVIPDRNPHKDYRELNIVCTILEISARVRFGKKQFLVPTFLLEPRRNPTVEWIELMRRKFPGNQLSLLIGYDSFEKILGWTRSEDLLRTLDCLYVVPRLEKDDARIEMIGKVKAVAPKLRITFLDRHDYEAVSSTDLRGRVRL